MKTLLIGLASASLLLSACNSGGPTYLTADQAPIAKIDVSATGEVAMAPDRALVSAGTVSEGKSARGAMIANATLMTAVYEALDVAGIEKRNIQTSNLTLQPKYSYQDRNRPRIDGYEARNQISITTDDLDQVGPLIDALVSAGVNNINNIQFTVKDPKSARDKARSDAIREARAKAESMAEAAGVKLGPLLNLSENNYGAPQPMIRSVSYSMAEADIATPVSGGQQTLSVRVNMTYRIVE